MICSGRDPSVVSENSSDMKLLPQNRRTSAIGFGSSHKALDGGSNANRNPTAGNKKAKSRPMFARSPIDAKWTFFNHRSLVITYHNRINRMASRPIQNTMRRCGLTGISWTKGNAVRTMTTFDNSPARQFSLDSVARDSSDIWLLLGRIALGSIFIVSGFGNSRTSAASKRALP